MFCALAVYLSLSCTTTEKNTLINLNRMRPAKKNIFYSPNGKMYKKKEVCESKYKCKIHALQNIQKYIVQCCESISILKKRS